MIPTQAVEVEATYISLTIVWVHLLSTIIISMTVLWIRLFKCTFCNTNMKYSRNVCSLNRHHVSSINFICCLQLCQELQRASQHSRGNRVETSCSLAVHRVDWVVSNSWYRLDTGHRLRQKSSVSEHLRRCSTVWDYIYRASVWCVAGNNCVLLLPLLFWVYIVINNEHYMITVMLFLHNTCKAYDSALYIKI